jgi:hypothetical protein
VSEVQQVTLTETVQARGETVTRERITVQDTSKLPPVYVLPGETMRQKLDSLKAMAAQRQLGQLELLELLDDARLAPLLLETTEVELE